jgi:hypothetical protein
MQLSGAEQRAWRILWIKGLIFAGALDMLDSRLVALILLLWACLLFWTLALRRAIVIYPALDLRASLSAYPSKWGPTVLFLVWIWNKLLVLLGTLLILHVFRWYLGRIVVVVLEEGIEIVLVLFAGSWQVWARALALMPLLGSL